MADLPYTKREIDLMTRNLSDQMNEICDKLGRQIKTYSDADKDAHIQMGVILSRVEAQTLKTNGRVNKLENFRWFIVGGLTVISAIVVPIAVYLINHHV